MTTTESISRKDPNLLPGSRRRHYTLTCGHLFIAQIGPSRGDELFCQKCNDFSSYMKPKLHASCEHTYLSCRSTSELYSRVKRHWDKHGAHDITLHLPDGERLYGGPR